MAESAPPAEMVWVDVETTGLVARDEVVLELGIALTDRWGAYVDSTVWLVGERNSQYYEAIERGKAHEIVGPMHEQSGLWNDWLNSDPTPAHIVADKATQWLVKHGVEKNTLPMAGNSIRLDREFCEEHLASFESHLHYRQIDISTVKELCRKLNPAVFGSVPEKYGNHRVLGDIQDSIIEYKFYIDNFLWVVEM